MSNTVIKVEHLYKEYKLGVIGTGTLYSDMQTFWAKLRGKADPNSKLDVRSNAIKVIDDKKNKSFLALADVSFDVDKGDIIGIIARNGAGKSTLLKLISRITSPTKGIIKIRGRVGSLLEVGTGFHPELTGRENIYLNGAILGMRKHEISKKFDEIIAFSGIEQFIDTPVKRYSSGMYVRLAFAVASHLDTEILLIDEVLAVGDAEFQKKCLGKMDEVSKNEGRTVMFVSHNMAAVQNLCPKSIWLEKGRVVQIGATSEVVHAYMSQSGIDSYSGEMDLVTWRKRHGNGEARIVSAKLLDAQGKETTVGLRTEPLTVEYQVEVHVGQLLQFSATIMTDTGSRIVHLSHHDTPGLTLGQMSGKYKVRFTMPGLPLNAGNYNFTLGVQTPNQAPVDVVRDVLPFVAEDYIDTPRPFKSINEYAFCWTPSNWEITAL